MGCDESRQESVPGRGCCDDWEFIAESVTCISRCRFLRGLAAEGLCNMALWTKLHTGCGRVGHLTNSSPDKCGMGAIRCTPPHDEPKPTANVDYRLPSID